MVDRVGFYLCGGFGGNNDPTNTTTTMTMTTSLATLLIGEVMGAWQKIGFLLYLK